MTGRSPEIRRAVFLDALRLSARIGIHEGETDVPQPLAVDIRLQVRKAPPGGPDPLAPVGAADPKFREVVCYDRLAVRIRGLAGSRIWMLVEDLAEEIVEMCFRDSRVEQIRLRVRKLNAVRDADGGGVEVLVGRPARPAE